MGRKTGTASGLALLLAAGMAWAGGASGGEGNRGLSPIIAEEGEIAMFTIDMPDMPYAHAPIVIAQSDSQQTVTQKTDRTIGVCHLASNVPSDQKSAINVISPAQSVVRYLKKIGRPEFEDMLSTSKVTMLKGPTSGEIKDLGTSVIRHGQQIDIGIRGYRYLALPNYDTVDKATFLVEIGGLKIKVVYRFVVAHSGWGGTDGYAPEDDKQFCPKGEIWKISSTLTDPTTLQSLLTQSGLDASAVTLQVADLTGSAVGSTSGTTITLDTNAAGHGWQ